MIEKFDYIWNIWNIFQSLIDDLKIQLINTFDFETNIELLIWKINQDLTDNWKRILYNILYDFYINKIVEFDVYSIRKKYDLSNLAPNEIKLVLNIFETFIFILKKINLEKNDDPICLQTKNKLKSFVWIYWEWEKWLRSMIEALWLDRKIFSIASRWWTKWVFQDFDLTQPWKIIEHNYLLNSTGEIREMKDSQWNIIQFFTMSWIQKICELYNKRLLTFAEFVELINYMWWKDDLENYQLFLNYFNIRLFWYIMAKRFMPTSSRLIIQWWIIQLRQTTYSKVGISNEVAWIVILCNNHPQL